MSWNHAFSLTKKDDTILKRHIHLVFRTYETHTKISA